VIALLTASALVGAFAGAAPAAAPSNDAFASAQPLAGAQGSVAGSTVDATRETGEPWHAGGNGSRSVWFRWTAPASGQVAFDTLTTTFDTALAVYTGSAVNALTWVASNHRWDSTGTGSRLRFAAVAGTTYRIAVDTYFSGDSGAFTLRWTPVAVPANDDLAAAQAISGETGTVHGDNTEASSESYEPWHAGSTAAASLWYRWTAPVTGDVSFDTVGASFDTVLAVYTPITVPQYPLNRVAENDDAWSDQTGSRIHLRATAGTTYFIAVDGRNAGFNRANTGAFDLRWSRRARPSHDHVGTPQDLAGPTGSLDASNADATSEPDERGPGYRGGHSVWYRLPSPGTGTLHVTVTGAFRPLVSVWRPAPYGPFRLASDFDPAATKKAHVAVSTVAGETYLIGIDGFGGAVGSFRLEWRWNTTPIRHSNDDWDRAEVLPALSGEIRTTTYGATAESCEPEKGGVASYASLWYRIRVPSSGRLIVETDGSRFDTVVTAAADKYDCHSLDGVPGNDNVLGSLTSRFVATAEHGRTYFISVSGQMYDTGAVVLRWRFDPATKPANDDFSAARTLAGRAGVQAFETNAGASKETGEPAHAGVTGGRSVWYRWTASASGPAAFRLTDTTYPFGFDPVLAAYTGPSVTALSPVAGNDDWRDKRQSRISFTAVAGTTYWIAVDGRDGREAEVDFLWYQGGFVLRWNSGPPPPNDNFSSARVVSGDYGSEQHTTVGATREPGEPRHWQAEDGGASVWFRWTAPVAGHVTFGIHSASDVAGLDAALYRGPGLTNLELLDSDESFFEDTYVSSRVAAGETVYVAVEGPRETTADFRFDWVGTPTNDAFAAAIPVSGSSGTITDTLEAATREQLEPRHGTASIWYRWTAPSTGLVTFDSCGSSGSWAKLAVYTGAALGSLNLVAEEGTTCDRGETVFFTARAGTTYSIAALGSGVGLRLDWHYGGPALTLVHDHLADPRGFGRDGGLDRALNVGATKEAGEPSHAGNAGGKSVWYRFEAIDAGDMTLETAGSGFDTLLAAYRMPKNVPVTMANLQLLAANDDAAGGTSSRVTFRTEPNELYYFAIDGKSGESGSYVVNGRFHEVPGNDNFPFGINLGGRNGSLTADSAVATRQANEPQHAGQAGGRSVWYRWTSHEPGPMVFDTSGSSFDTVLAAYTGSQLGSLTAVAGNDDEGGRQTSHIAFNAVAGVDYWIAVDGKSGAGGHIVLNLGGGNPPNDYFGNAQPIAGVSGTVSGTTVGATREQGEECCVGSPSVWYRWTAPASQAAIFDTRGTSQAYDSRLYVYLGDSMGALETVAEDDNSAPNRASRVTFPAVAGRTYHVKVETWSPGAVKLNWNGPDTTAPTVVLEVPEDGAIIGDPIDVVADASDDHDVTLVDFMLDGSVVERVCNCVREPKFTELWFPGFSPDGTYSMTARAHDPHGNRTTSAAKRVTLDHRWPLIRLTGPLPPRRTTARTATISFEADELDVTYTCSFDGVRSSCSSPQTFSGLADGMHTFQVRAEDRARNPSDWAAHSWLVTSAPANDLFSGANAITGTSGSVTGSNADATLEQGEPAHAGNVGGRSLWYRFQAAAAGPVTLTTAGSSFDTVLAVYRGSGVDALIRVAADDDGGGGDHASRLSFDAVSGTTYLIAVDGFDGASGPFRLGWGLGAVTDPTVLAAGDVADCIGDGEYKTATIIDGYPNATVAALGDLAYFAGTPDEFQSCYEPSWGRHKARTRPTPGNHEYGTANAAGYFGYFGSSAGPTGKGWYSYDLGGWHVVVLNSNCTVVDCSVSSEQLQWLRDDLAAHPVDCTLAYWHHPLFTSGTHAGDSDLPLVRTFWDELYARGVDLILNGHDHDYERFAPQTPAGVPDAAYGIREFVVGTGGAILRGQAVPRPATSEAFYSATYGVLKLVLQPGGYAWEFLGEPGTTFTDSGTGNCHAAPDQSPPETNPTLSSSHTSAWSNDNTVQVNWSGASDSGSGIDGFSYEWSQSPTTTPDTVKDAEETANSATSGELADGDWWFHLRTKDNAGNWSGAVHLGPIRIDIAAPTNPTLSSGSHVANAWSVDFTVDAAWSGATDGHSGIDGYAFSWTQQAATDPGTTKNAEETISSTTSPTLADGSWWLHLRTTDNAGNWSAAVHLGPFRIDTSPPSNPLPSSTHPSDWSTDDTVDVGWSGANDTGSGLDGFSYSWTQEAATDPDTTKDAEEIVGSAASGPLADGQWWFHLRTRDNAGNWSSATHLGPFRIDRAPPGNPTLSFSHVEDDWSNDDTVEASWTGATDPLSGVDGFAYSWTQQATTDPGTAKTAEEGIGTTSSGPLPDGSWWFHFRTRDNAGNWSAPVHHGPFKIDTTAPTNPTLSSPSHVVGEWSNEATVVVEWDGEPGHQYSFDWSQDQTDVPDDIAEGPDPQAAETLPDGSWWFLLRTRDVGGSWSGTARFGPFLLDTTAPVTTITAGPPGSTTENAAVFEFSASEAASLVCGLDGAGLAACASPVRYEALATGDHVFRVQATDRAGNRSPAAEWRWTIAAAPPPPPPPPSPPQPPPPPPVDPPPKRPPQVARCVVPRVVGRTLRRARIMISSAGCRVGPVRHVYSTRIRKGFVVTQGPRAGRRLPRGTRVGMVVSLGKKPAPRRR
jgi:hypothetical protein